MPSADAVVLPDNVRPVHYDLTLTPNFDDFTFAGEVDITVSMQPGTSEIVLNCAEIDIHTATVSWTDTNGEQEQAASGIAYDADAERAIISIPGYAGRWAGGQPASADDVHRRAERQAPRFLPQPIYQPRRRNRLPRHYAV